jgi:hypothetical protein
MVSLTLTMLVAIVIGIICIRITLNSSYEPPAPWECDTCGDGNAPSALECGQCGMERPA